MKGLIVYKGKYGATEQYAHWLAEELQLLDVAADNLSSVKLKDYDFLLIGTSVYIGKLQIDNWLKNNLSYIRTKKIFLFVVSATPPGQKEKLSTYVTSGVPGEIRANCQAYFLPGKMIMKNLSWKDRFLLKMGAKLAKDPNDRKNMLTDFNNVKKEHLAELIVAVKKFAPAKEVIMPA
jgi:menaquinone-dependent protoporphyrinogen IX oxidase